jgi:SAM-dependent methyltransferase
MERAKEFPLAQVTGLDIESHLPVPPLPQNFQFVQANVLMGLPFPDASFDFVHQRFLVGAIPAQQWPSVLQEVVRVTRPGGWVELLESGFVYHHAGPATKQFQSWWQTGEKALGFNLALIPHLDQMLKNAGMKQVQMKTVPLPLGKWGGRAGEMLATDMHAVFTSFRAVYVSRLGIPAQRFEEALVTLPQEWEHYHTSYECYVVYGRR